MTEVRKGELSEAPRIAATLASAFAEDPVMRWMSGQDDTEQRVLPFWNSMVKTALKPADHEVLVADDLACVAIWRGVDKWKLPTRDVVTSVPAMVRSFGRRIPGALQLLTKMEKAHPTEPHYYLEFLGTRRDQQGKGRGTSVMQPMLDRCDREGLPAYLESSNPQNIPFYARHGFVEREGISAPKGGPTLTMMWRDPRS